MTQLSRRRRCRFCGAPTEIIFLAGFLLHLARSHGTSAQRREGVSQITRQSPPERKLQDYSQTNRRRHYTFVVVPKQNNLPFFDPVKLGCEEEALKLTQKFSQGDVIYPSRYPQNGATVECLFVGPDDRANQRQMVEDLLWGGSTNHTIDGLAVSVNDDEEMTPILDRAVQELSIPVITFDSDASRSLRHYYVGTNNSFMGRQLARAMETLKPNGGPYGVVSSHAPNLRERVEGIKDELNHASNWHHRWELLDDEPFWANDNLTRTFEKMEEWAKLNPAVIVSTYGNPMRIQEDPSTNTSISLWGNFVERHRHRNITFLCGDAQVHQLEFLQSDLVDGLVGQLPYDMGIKSIQTLWTLSFEPNAELGDPEDFEDGDADDTSEYIGTNVVSHVHIPLRLPPVEVDNHLVGELRFVGYTLYGVIAVMAIGFAIWVFARRNVRVVRAAQPRFLIMIAMGVLIMGACMIPLGMDDGGGTRADCFDSSIELGEHCTAICMSVPWLASIGFTITFSALYSKTRRVNRIFRSSAAFGRVQVKERDVLVPFFVLLGANVLILTLWTILDPLTYTRVADYGRDGWNRVVSTYGICMSNSQWHFLIPLAVVNMGVLVLANWQAYEARDIESEFAETKYIAICMASLLQATITGVPAIFIVRYLPKAYYIVLVLLIFVVCMVILMAIFVPKIFFAMQFMDMSPRAQREYMTEAIGRTTKASNSNFSPSTTKSTKFNSGSGFQYSGLDYSVPQSKGAMRMSSLGMNGPSGAMSNFSNKPAENEDSNTNSPASTTEGRESSSSDDAGFVFYRKNCAKAIWDEAAAKEKRHSSTEKQPENAANGSGNKCLDSANSKSGSVWTKVHDDVIPEGNEQEEEHKEEVNPPQPMDDLELAEGAKQEE